MDLGTQASRMVIERLLSVHHPWWWISYSLAMGFQAPEQYSSVVGSTSWEHFIMAALAG